MFGTLRGGRVLVRNLQRCVRRPNPLSLVNRTLPLPHRAITFPIRTFYVSPLLRNSAGEAVSPVTSADVPTPPEGETKKLLKFADLHGPGLVDKKIVDAILKMGITDMTEIQAQTINHTLNGKDVLAQAKTGTGKTLAFLVPVIQKIIRDDPSLRTGQKFRQRGGSNIRAVVISPTRELAEQIAEEAQKIARFTGVQVRTAVGGTRKIEGLRRIQREGCHLLVGTPGRLIDIFSDPRSGIAAPNLKAFVLDEADRLLDDGFAPSIMDLQTYFPKRSEVDRQTLMFSATIAPEILSMVRRTLKQDFSFVKTVRDDEAPTHLKVPQRAVFLDCRSNQMPAIMEILTQAIRRHETDPVQNSPFKAIVYYNSTNEVSIAAAAFNALLTDPESRFSPHPFGIRGIEIHSKLTQAQRTRNSDMFRRAKSAILFSSDVTARGMDFPNVTHVIQVGVPQSRETYIHRLGRTARANKTGEGWILLTDPEYREFKTTLRGLPIQEDEALLKTAMIDMSRENPDAPEPTASIISQAKQAYSGLDYTLKEKAYMSSLGLIRSRDQFRQLNNMTKHLWSLDSPPPISLALARRLNIRHYPGIVIESARSEPSALGSPLRDESRRRRMTDFGDQEPYQQSFQRNDRRSRRTNGFSGEGRYEPSFRRNDRRSRRMSGFGGEESYEPSFRRNDRRSRGKTDFHHDEPLDPLSMGDEHGGSGSSGRTDFQRSETRTRRWR
ncbi:ATP-dependent RNA helicase mss116, mitochondrial precursor, putative [Coccidioides posadasii C735 delta SOWgp]|uniref:ATP-dependent RNA helicase n=1 Tax=Coccidioides posadasii (strain C735) TaxID=222929 RepID=C5PAC7_COCP7|nr:ATP-dependent RNA helicase mss116, mitochondrial precursor, putative [Coccidioides posadasii C735 delta SOWgp]EER26689.1 ATP-dependent RNA helicase mss116, mitochondrial precursor, putative [Coccidioides posadasii C735 delta SOWgp]|eukprot:XP_003068834.1 ATP-dependent RNA helicase mss116, mitochondrial precursor, putative [Coccidioides posadasii C735 delta SOWgp]